jgi:hypothetical protein
MSDGIAIITKSKAVKKANAKSTIKVFGFG